jgi:hypothetical protein
MSCCGLEEGVHGQAPQFLRSWASPARSGCDFCDTTHQMCASAHPAGSHVKTASHRLPGPWTEDFIRACQCSTCRSSEHSAKPAATVELYHYLEAVHVAAAARAGCLRVLPATRQSGVQTNRARWFMFAGARPSTSGASDSSNSSCGAYVVWSGVRHSCSNASEAV